MVATGQHVVLVHGACHGAWSWFKMAPLLRSAGHRVTVPDLAASGIDSRKIEEVPTFAAYTQPLLELMDLLPANEKVILVGHSLGGQSIALAAERFPKKVAAMVFVTALMPDCAHNPAHPMKPPLERPQAAWLDTQFRPVETPESKQRAAPPLTSMLLGPQVMASKLYQLCSPEDLALASLLVRPCLMFDVDLASMPALSKDRYGSVPAFYVLCSEDAAIVKEHQQWMIQNHTVSEVFEIAGADHMPMLSTPQELCQYLNDIADKHIRP